MNDKGSSGRSPSESSECNNFVTRSHSRSGGRYSCSTSRSPSPGGSPHRSRSKSYHSYKKGRYSRSRSKTYSGSRSSSYKRGRRSVSTVRPKPNRCVGVFGLSLRTTERQLRDIFSKYGKLDKVQVIYDAKTGHSRGFAFVYYDSVEDADYAKEQSSGMEIDGRKIRVDFSVTQRPHTPTPGIYMGNPTYVRGGWRKRYNDYHHRSSYYRSSSPYYRRSRYRRSHSRSYSPRRYYRSPSPYSKRCKYGRLRSRSRSYSRTRY